jgi:hypothetical protein
VLAMIGGKAAQEVKDAGGIDRFGQQHTEMIAALAVGFRQKRMEASPNKHAVPMQGGEPVRLGSNGVVAVLVDVERAALALIVGVGRVQAEDVAGVLGSVVVYQQSAAHAHAPC